MTKKSKETRTRQLDEEMQENALDLRETLNIKSEEISESFEKAPEVVFYETLAKLHKEFGLGKYDLSKETVNIKYISNDGCKYKLILNNEKILVEISGESSTRDKYFIDKDGSYGSKTSDSKPGIGAKGWQQKSRLGGKFNNRGGISQRHEVTTKDVTFDGEKFNKTINELIKNKEKCKIERKYE